MNIFIYTLVALLGYLIGCSNMAFYVSKYKKVDMRASGSASGAVPT